MLRASKRLRSASPKLYRIRTGVLIPVQSPQSVRKRKRLKIKENLMRPVWPQPCTYRSVCAQHRTRRCGSISRREAQALAGAQHLRKEVNGNGDNTKVDQGNVGFHEEKAGTAPRSRLHDIEGDGRQREFSEPAAGSGRLQNAAGYFLRCYRGRKRWQQESHDAA